MFGKIFETLYGGSMIGSGPVTFAVWPYVIANQKPSREYGSTVEINPKLMAFIIGTTEEAINAAVEFLCRPDPKSRSKDKNGRRLIRLSEYEYQVVNGAHYRSVRDQEERKSQVREAQRRFRAKKDNKTNEKPPKNGTPVEPSARGDAG